jgi:hypothetical protein
LYNPLLIRDSKKIVERRAMKASKVLGIAIFLLFIGQMEARERNLTNATSHCAVAIKARKKNIVKASRPKAVKKLKKVKPVTKKVSKPKKVKLKKVKLQTPRAAKKPKKVKVKVAKVKGANKRRAKMVGFYNAFEYGFLKYAKDKEENIVDATSTVNNTTGLLGDASKDKIIFTKTRPALQVGLGGGLEFEGLPSFQKGKTTRGRLGVATSFAKKDDAVEGEYFDTGQTEALLVTRQDIKRFEGLVVGEYDIFNGYGWTYKLDAGVGVVVGALRDLYIYEKSGENLYHTGQRLEPKKVQPTGRIGASLEKKCGRLIVGAGYRIGFTRQKYKNHVILDTPHASASQVHHNAHTVLHATSVKKTLLHTPPEFDIRSYEFRISVGTEF